MTEVQLGTEATDPNKQPTTKVAAGGTKANRPIAILTQIAEPTRSAGPERSWRMAQLSPVLSGAHLGIGRSAFAVSRRTLDAHRGALWQVVDPFTVTLPVDTG